MLASYFDYIFLHLRQKARLRPELSPTFCQLLARTRPEKFGQTYNSGAIMFDSRCLYISFFLHIFISLFYILLHPFLPCIRVKRAFRSNKFLHGFLSKNIDRSEDWLHKICSFLRLSVPKTSQLFRFTLKTTFFPLEIFPGLPTTNKLSKS